MMSLNRVICRLIASWSIYICTTISFDGSFSELGFNQKINPIIPMLIVSAVFFLLTVAAYYFKGYNSDSWFLFFAATVCMIWWCVASPSTQGRAYFWLAAAFVYSIFLLYTAFENRELFSKLNVGNKTLIFTVFALSLVSFTVLSVIGCLRYKTFSSPNFDFGIFVNMFHNMKECGLPLTTCERDGLLSHFAVHISPVYYILLPFYMLFPTPYTLQISQSAVLIAAVIPLVLLSKHFKLSNKLTVCIAALYLFYAAVSTGCLYDIHENCFLPLFLLLTFYFFEKGSNLPMFLCILLTLAVKEDAAIYVAVFGMYILLSRKKYIKGGTVCALAAVYFMICVAVLERYGLGIMSNRYENLIFDADNSLLGALVTALLNPGYLLTQLFSTEAMNADKLIYFLKLLLPLSFIPFFSSKLSSMILLSPLLLNLLTMYVYQYDICFQYSFGIAAFLFYATVLNIKEMSRKSKITAITVAVSFCMMLYASTVLPEFGYYTKSAIDNSEYHRRLEEILEKVSDDASVCASTFLLPHLADRNEIYEIEYHQNRCDVDYVVLDARFENYKEHMKPYIECGYQIFFFEENMILILLQAEDL